MKIAHGLMSGQVLQRNKQNVCEVKVRGSTEASGTLQLRIYLRLMIWDSRVYRSKRIMIDLYRYKANFLLRYVRGFSVIANVYSKW
jgi:hypothetical protein